LIDDIGTLSETDVFNILSDNMRTVPFDVVFAKNTPAKTLGLIQMTLKGIRVFFLAGVIEIKRGHHALARWSGCAHLVPLHIGHQVCHAIVHRDIGEFSYKRGGVKAQVRLKQKLNAGKNFDHQKSPVLMQ